MDIILMMKFPKKNLFYVVFFKKTERNSELFDFERKTITKRRSISVFDMAMRITCTVKNFKETGILYLNVKPLLVNDYALVLETFK